MVFIDYLKKGKPGNYNIALFGRLKDEIARKLPQIPNKELQDT